MFPEKIVLQSAGSLSVAILAFIMMVLQTVFFIKKRQFTNFAWGAAISFSALIYSVGVFVEYNTYESELNRYAGLLEYTAIILLIHCLFGFTFSYHKLQKNYYQIIVSLFHAVLLICLWFTDWFVSTNFVLRDFVWLDSPYIEPALGPYGFLFVIYSAISATAVGIIWLSNKDIDLKYRINIFVGMGVWLLLGIHDGLASLGVPTFQYFMEYGFLAFAVVILIGVFNSYVDVEAEEKYRVITEFANDGILIIQDGKIVFGNPACRDLLGQPLTETAAKDFLEIMYPEDQETVYKHYRALLENGGSVTPKTVRIVRKNGDKRHVEISANAIEYRGRPAVLAIMRDMTERKKQEEARQESERKIARLKKMESLGVLAGGVAHDLNNVLSGITSYPELILLDLPEDSKLRKPIETIQQSGNKAASIVEDLLTIARGVSVKKEALNINDVILDYLQSPEHEKLISFHPSIAVETDLDDNLLRINGSRTHVQKLIMNLVSNASEAIDGKGNVSISTKNCYLDQPVSNYEEINEGDFVLLAVSDDGGGILSNDLERIFEPFYTKKVMGRSGTGLGLTLVWNVINDHNGYIEVKSDEIKTTFELYFPSIRDRIENLDNELSIDDLKGNGESILIVDDVESQRQILSSILRKLNYNVVCVPSGEEAIGYLKINKANLVILDMIMDPGISGRETLKEILKIHPDQKSIIVSGYSETEDVEMAIKMGSGQYIKKPYNIHSIGNAVISELKDKKNSIIMQHMNF